MRTTGEACFLWKQNDALTTGEGFTVKPVDSVLLGGGITIGEGPSSPPSLGLWDGMNPPVIWGVIREYIGNPYMFTYMNCISGMYNWITMEVRHPFINFWLLARVRVDKDYTLEHGRS